jgi:hypothetical protein
MKLMTFAPLLTSEVGNFIRDVIGNMLAYRPESGESPSNPLNPQIRCGRDIHVRHDKFHSLATYLFEWSRVPLLNQACGAGF